MKDAGWEIASHGLKWIEYKDATPEVENADMLEAIRLHTEVVGQAPVGLYIGRCSDNTVRLAAENGSFKYVADSIADDVPYWMEFGEHDQLVVPYTMDANDMRFATPQGFNTGAHFFEYLKASFDVLYAEGGRMMSIGLHCRLIGRPGRAQALQHFLEYANSHKGVWFATREQIADHWAATNPHVRYERPSEMTRETFVAKYGSIFEHSPWIADGAYDLELGPVHDTAIGLHNALCRIFRSSSEQQRLGVLTAHPDLAGKLAQANSLTAESTAEQAAAGLDHLTDDEKATFTTLNDEYVAKHGFPFIIAVRDYDKASILAAFKTRINNDRSAEFAEACKQVERIADFRLMDILP